MGQAILGAGQAPDNVEITKKQNDTPPRLSKQAGAGEKAIIESLWEGRKLMVSLSTFSKYTAALAAVLALACTEAPAQDEAATAEPVKPVKRVFNKEAIGHYNRARALYEQGFLNKAIEAYKAAIVADDRMDQAYCNLGLIYINQNNYAKAQEAFKKALSLKPDSAYSLNGMASVLFYRGQVEQSIEKWQQAVKVDPRFASAYMNMARALENRGRKEEALAAYVKSIALQPDLAVSYYYAGLLMLDFKHEPQAFALLTRAVALNPESEWARDGRKKLESLKSKLNKETDAGPEIAEMKVIGVNGELIKEEKPEDKLKDSTKDKKEAKKSKEKIASDTNSSDKKAGLMGRFKKKDKPQTEMKMYVKEPSSNGDSIDLQGKPEVN